ncbi:MAG TPA: class I SAM-dependent methyltransferase [Gallionella sp.]|nr:class I SAM-dependent methyltransferase [Gallionella sp.]
MDRTEVRQLVYRFLRRTYLLGLVDFLFFVKAVVKEVPSNRKFKKTHPSAKVPPYSIMFDALHVCTYEGYYESGLMEADLLVKAFRKYKPEEELVIAEWGCGPARIIQHLKKYDTNIKKVIGTDYNPETIKWCQNSFDDIEFYLNGLAPPLPLQSHSIDIVYAISVFTHLSEPMHHAWVGELLRVLKPGGLLLITVHGEEKIKNLLPDELSIFNSGNLVVRENVAEGKKHFLAYQSENFVRNKLLFQFSKVERLEGQGMHQDVWIAIAPAG